MDMAEWLRGLGLERYEPAFRDNDIDWEVLRRLTAKDLRELGVTSIGHRRRLLDAISVLGTAAAPPALTTVPTAASEAERRQLTVMFCDLVGSTALSARFDPEDLREIVGTYHRCVADTVGRFAGFVAKYMGDGVLIYFGYPEAHEDDAERAVRAGLAVVDAVGRLATPEPLNVRLGIASGLVVVGDLIGAGAAQERGVVGETPNLAARLQVLAQPGTLVIGDSTRRQIGALFEIEDLGPQPLAGFAEPQRAWRVVGESDVLSRFEALRSEAAPLIGRDEELDLLRRRWQQAKAGEGRLVLVSGEPGIGKSRLSVALSERIEGDPHTRLRYFCSPHHQDSALYPFIAQLERAAGFVRDDTVEQRLGKLRELLTPAARGDDEIELLTELLSLPTSAAGLNLSPQRKREMLFEALLHQLTALARSRPVLMVFEDAHWIDPTSRELLDLTFDRVARLPVLVVVTFRPEFQHSWGGQPHVTALTLSRLGEPDGSALVERLAGNTGLSRETVDEIVERADGVPLFVEELTKAVLESGHRDNRVAAVLAASPLPEHAIPATLHASLIARLDRLGSIAKEIGQIGAVIGREFGYDLIEGVAQRPAAELRSGLDRLAEAGLLFCRSVPPHSSYLFKHALVQDAAYGTLLRARRQELHARVAAALEQHFADLVERQPELLAHHLTAAGDVERAIEFWRSAGAHSIAASAHREAVGHFGRALALLGMQPAGEPRDRRELDLTLCLVVPLIALHGFGSTQVEVRAIRAKELSDRFPDSPGRFAAQRVVWNSCLLRQPVPRTVALARDLFEFAESIGNPVQLAIAYRALGYSVFMAGELASAAEALAKGAALADSIPDSDFSVYGEHPSLVCRVYGSQVRALMGYGETAVSLGEAAIVHARNRNNPHSLAWALSSALYALWVRREPAEVARLASEAIEISRRHRLSQWLATSEAYKGWAMCHLGETTAGLDLLNKGVRDWHATGAVLHTTHMRARLAEAYLVAGEPAAAELHLAVARAHCEQYGERYIGAELWRLTALVSQAGATRKEAVERQLYEALMMARHQQACLLELRAATNLARLWGEQGRRAEARELLASVYGWFTEGFDTADLKDAKALLDALA